MRRPALLPPALCLAAGALAACSDSGGGPGGPDPIQAAGSYASVFTATQVTNCGDFVEPGAANGTLLVTQAGNQVTLRLPDLSEFILDPATGTITESGAFSFSGPVRVGDGDTSLTANGVITGTFTAGGAMNLAFEFTLLTCSARGTITGQR